jgi:hypothetical protein
MRGAIALHKRIQRCFDLGLYAIYVYTIYRRSNLSVCSFVQVNAILVDIDVTRINIHKQPNRKIHFPPASVYMLNVLSLLKYNLIGDSYLSICLSVSLCVSYMPMPI